MVNSDYVMIQQICKNCGNAFEGKFCNMYGEKIYAEKDKSIRNFLHETFHFFTHLDNKFFKTLLLIFTKPGVLAFTYCNGIRNKYYKPVSLFFIGVIIYLLFPFFPGLNMSFEGNIINFKSQGMGFTEKLVQKKITAKHISFDELAWQYDHKSPAFAKILLLIILPLSGLALKRLFPKKRKYYFDHLILGTEAGCVTLYLNFFILPLILYLPAWILKQFNIDSGLLTDVFTMPVFAVFLVYWGSRAFKRFYEIPVGDALAKAFLFLLFQSAIIFILYRLILFLTVLFFI